ncbi:uncharacterized protein LOC110450922 [Mizuhopecten yessoensis]|uniref:FMRFamide-related peptides type HF-4 n=1 Tax=Mizuhopecten yessoensis TaxID=6573 RepID=A0A210QMV8_MIZYE|nr:uncharacterized protein LOC110450922 [Mizuhopecten yessoensis]XP_021354402.1 uncharacterized protein LOC110450922 [Mizuhopecten yessoensis]XP_021354403.1 uncharacterized protein LOC110450922 [Mizuhopecten yessoensis]XP_021354404.1 uncharacterized protein LOC110450922 [Mizuhopecten yessoensis]XP_021354405.1 uncharacterized protein LOC110450922 [Mizuhopecten yessoensis]OWF50069.1 FMRFamide-related peptides type HF-4 [Mizuhopecten yessoensis]
MTVELALNLDGFFIPVIGGVVGLFLLVYVVGGCLCLGGKQKETSLSTGKYVSGRDTDTAANPVESVTVDVDNGLVPLENGQAGGSLRISNNSQRSPGHSPHHANQRQLPAPPQSNGAVNPTLPMDENDCDDYDHLEKSVKPGNKRGSNYDHVILGEDGSVKIKERKIVSDTDYAEVSIENIYTPVKEQETSANKARVNILETSNEDEYAMVSDEREPMLPENIKGKEDPYAKVKEKEDPYAKVKDKKDPYNKVKEPDDPYNKVKEKDDPYNKVKEKDDPYNKVKEKDDPYNRVKEKDDPYNKVKEKDDPYNKVKEKDDPYNRFKEKDDPYNKVKDDDPYNKVKEKDDPYNKVKDDDPYNRVKEEGESGGSFMDFDPYNKVKDVDPYNKVKDTDPYNKVKDVDPYNRVEDVDPYNRIKGDDPPYNKIKGDDIDDPYNKVDEDDFVDITEDPKYPYSMVDPNRKAKQVTTITVTHNGAEEPTASPAGAPQVVDTFKVEEGTDEYAVVVKNRSDSSSVATVVTESMVTDNPPEVSPYTLPPEPPRNYRSEETSVQAPPSTHGSALPPVSSVNQSQTQTSAATSVSQTSPAEGDAVQDTGPPRREPGYIKLTSRESMASINARRSLNTYETVAETENMYATVEGSSGDGIVQAAPTNPVPSRASLPNDFYAEIGGSGDGVVPAPSPNPIPNRNSLPNDFYAEIGASGEQQARVPAPPSLDSLHLMTKTHHEGRQGSRSSTEESEFRHSIPEQLSPSAFVNSPPYGASARTSYAEPKVSSPNVRGTNGNVILDPNYQTVRDCVNDPDLDCDIDPNYESVEEAKAKAFVLEEKKENGQNSTDTKIKRNHVYEEVKPSSETRGNQTRALRSHMYEDINEVQEQKRELNRKSQVISKSKKM